MSILGVKKKHIDTSEIEKKITKINIDLQTINTNDKELYKGINNVILRVNNNEKMININKNKPDRKIITIFAGIDGPIALGQLFTFGDGGHSFLLSNPGQILSISVISAAPSTEDLYVNVILHGDSDGVSDTLRTNIRVQNTRTYFEFVPPLLVKAGYTIGFGTTGTNSENINALVSAIIEVFL